MPEAANWRQGLEPEIRSAMEVFEELLAVEGPNLRMPHARKVHGTRLTILEGRPSSKRFAIRVFYAFDRNRQAVVLTAGQKKGVADENSWTSSMAKRAEGIWEAYQRSQGQWRGRGMRR